MIDGGRGRRCSSVRDLDYLLVFGIIDLSREPNAGYSQPPAVVVPTRSSTYAAKQRVLLLAYCNNKRYYGAKHNHKLE